MAGSSLWDGDMFGQFGGQSKFQNIDILLFALPALSDYNVINGILVRHASVGIQMGRDNPTH